MPEETKAPTPSEEQAEEQALKENIASKYVDLLEVLGHFDYLLNKNQNTSQQDYAPDDVEGIDPKVFVREMLAQTMDYCKRDKRGLDLSIFQYVQFIIGRLEEKLKKYKNINIDSKSERVDDEGEVTDLREALETLVRNKNSLLPVIIYWSYNESTEPGSDRILMEMIKSTGFNLDKNKSLLLKLQAAIGVLIEWKASPTEASGVDASAKNADAFEKSIKEKIDVPSYVPNYLTGLKAREVQLVKDLQEVTKTLNMQLDELYKALLHTDNINISLEILGSYIKSLGKIKTNNYGFRKDIPEDDVPKKIDSIIRDLTFINGKISSDNFDIGLALDSLKDDTEELLKLIKKPELHCCCLNLLIVAELLDKKRQSEDKVGYDQVYKNYGMQPPLIKLPTVERHKADKSTTTSHKKKI